MSSSSAASRSGVGALALDSSSWPSSSCLRSISLRAAQPVDGAVLGGGHQPGAGLVGDARSRPLLERGDERVLRQLLGHADVAHHAREAGDELGLLDPEDRVDGVMGIGSRHGYRSQHLRSAGARLQRGGWASGLPLRGILSASPGARFPRVRPARD